MSLCRLACRQAPRLRTRAPAAVRRAASLAIKASSVRDILASPTWSVRSLRSSPASDDQPPPEPISPSQLHHILRLAALPLPESKDEEDSMIATLQSQLHFVRAVQSVDTHGVEPLSAIRDETDRAVEESTVGLEDLRHVLDKEALVGHYKRPKRVKDDAANDSESATCDALSTASRKAGKYFVVDSGPKKSDSS